MTSDCVFCRPTESEVFLENELACAMWDSFPITDLHVLVVPRRHVEDYFGLTREELLACDDLLRQAGDMLRAREASITGLHIVVNSGSSAGQKVFHCHFHLIPRRAGDTDELWGRLRRVTSYLPLALAGAGPGEDRDADAPTPARARSLS